MIYEVQGRGNLENNFPDNLCSSSELPGPSMNTPEQWGSSAESVTGALAVSLRRSPHLGFRPVLIEGWH